MMRSLAIGIVAIAACSLLPACDSQQKATQMQLTAGDSAQLERLYLEATAEPQFRRAHRKPVRDARARAMRDLAAETEAMLVAHRSSAEAHALTGDDGVSPAACAAYAESLADLARAARAGDRAAVRAAYARVAAAPR